MAVGSGYAGSDGHKRAFTGLPPTSGRPGFAGCDLNPLPEVTGRGCWFHGVTPQGDRGRRGQRGGGGPKTRTGGIWCLVNVAAVHLAAGNLAEARNKK